ncbi:oxygenase MpaB family protein [Streptomyces sp. NPDC087263]|uniref:oxygenase MpaB family protein n=1 Tax=Streptomyces sp. NPDC087263 TaxID=3365773 RepID=UPI003826FDD3
MRNQEARSGPMACHDGRRWPTERAGRDVIVAQFGQGRAELMGWALTTGDPLADAVVEEIHAHGRPVRAALHRGLTSGLASLTDPPPAVAALLAQCESVPGYVDDELLDRGSLPFFNAPAPAHAISLSAGALVRIYESPSIAKVLAITGQLLDGVPRRLQETGKWVVTAMLPGSLRCGEPGYVATVQVRMLHAHMRRLALSKGYDPHVYGAPINQVDLARTWMDFTLTSYRAEARMGWAQTSAETASLYRYWWYIAHLLGIDAALVQGITSHLAAERVDELLGAVTGPAIPESSRLASATLEAIAGDLRRLARIPTRVGLPVLYALTRRFHGRLAADELCLPRATAADAALGPVIRVIGRRRGRLRREPAAWHHRQEQALASARVAVGLPGDPAAYQNQDQDQSRPSASGT